MFKKNVVKKFPTTQDKKIPFVVAQFIYIFQIYKVRIGELEEKTFVTSESWKMIVFKVKLFKWKIGW